MYVGRPGLCFPVELLKKNNHLKVLDLQMNGISSKGCKTLAEGLKQNSSVVEINLGNNKLNDSEMEEIRIALPRIDIRCPMPGSTLSESFSESFNLLRSTSETTN